LRKNDSRAHQSHTSTAPHRPKGDPCPGRGSDRGPDEGLGRNWLSETSQPHVRSTDRSAGVFDIAHGAHPHEPDMKSGCTQPLNVDSPPTLRSVSTGPGCNAAILAVSGFPVPPNRFEAGKTGD
jgi:hypothetical protein